MTSSPSCRWCPRRCSRAVDDSVIWFRGYAHPQPLRFSRDRLQRAPRHAKSTTLARCSALKDRPASRVVNFPTIRIIAHQADAGRKCGGASMSAKGASQGANYSDLPSVFRAPTSGPHPLALPSTATSTRFRSTTPD